MSNILEIRALLARHIHEPVFDFCMAQYLWYIDDEMCDAAESGCLDTVKYSVSIGANVHADDDHALRWAAEYGHLDTVKHLISVGADNVYAIRLAAKNNHSDVVSYLKSVTHVH